MMQKSGDMFYNEFKKYSKSVMTQKGGGKVDWKDIRSQDHSCL